MKKIITAFLILVLSFGLATLTFCLFNSMTGIIHKSDPLYDPFLRFTYRLQFPYIVSEVDPPAFDEETLNKILEENPPKYILIYKTIEFWVHYIVWSILGVFAIIIYKLVVLRKNNVKSEDD